MVIERGSKIDLLRAYRTCLVSDVVTGKLDVRAAATKLPDQTEKIVPEDDALDSNENGD